MDYKFLLEMMLKNLEEGVLVVDTEANITFFNEPTANIAGIELDGAIGKNVLEIFCDLTPETSTFYHVLKSRKPLIEHVQTYTNYEGKLVTTVTSTLPLVKNGVLIGAMEIYRGVDQVKKLSDKIVALQNELYNMYRKQKEHKENGTLYSVVDLIGVSPSILKLKDQVYKIADSASPVFIYGETGTGKEVVVQSIHNASLTRRNKPFIAQNCAAIPGSLLEGILFGTSLGSFTGAKDKPGLFELANGGTLFLDEVNSMDPGLQAKLLRVLQDGVVRRLGGAETIQVDVRVIAASNLDPLAAIASGALREDLYYRLNVISLALEPLRARREDIPVLADLFIHSYNTQFGKQIVSVSDAAMQALIRYDWPGNVRQLKYVLESVIIFSEKDVIDLEDLPAFLGLCAAAKQTDVSGENVQKPIFASNNNETNPNLVPLGPLKMAVEAFEKNLIFQALRTSKGNIAEAARLLQLPKQTLYNKILRHGITLEVVALSNEH